MLKKVLAFVAMLYAAASFAAVDVNKATAAELDGIKGIGPGISGKIIEERKKGSFKDWNDFISRVQGVGETNAAKYSAEGLTVNGAAFKGAAAAPAAKKEDKPMAKAEEKKGDAKPPAAKDEKKDAKAEAKKEADMKAKEAKKNEKPAAKDEKKDAKAEAAKTAAPAEAAKK